MNTSSLILPLIIIAALGTTVAYFLGRRQNVMLMKLYAGVMEEALRPADQKYTWIGGYLGYRADYVLKDDVVKGIKATLHLKPRMSIMYLPVSRFTMPHDKLYVVIESKKGLPGEAHLIKKGQYRFVPAGIDRIEQFHRKEIAVGGVEFQVLYQRRLREDRPGRQSHSQGLQDWTGVHSLAREIALPLWSGRLLCVPYGKLISLFAWRSGRCQKTSPWTRSSLCASAEGSFSRAARYTAVLAVAGTTVPWVLSSNAT
jgi:hypothetical protein